MSYQLKREWPGEGRPWSFSANKDKIYDEASLNGDVSIGCTEEDGSITRFSIPVGPTSYFNKYILPKLSFDAYNRCTFEISQKNYKFTWRYRIYMDGRPFICQSLGSLYR